MGVFDEFVRLATEKHLHARNPRRLADNRAALNGAAQELLRHQRAHVSHVREIAEGKQRPAPMAAPVAPAPPLPNASPAPQDTATASPACPRCGSANTVETAHFGSTACKALYKCLDCQEPFDYFKPY